MVRRATGLRNRKSKSKVDIKVCQDRFDYHEGLSLNQVKIILAEFGFDGKFEQFASWMVGQTSPIIHRSDKQGRLQQVYGTYEYDLFRWINSQKKGTPLIWD